MPWRGGWGEGLLERYALVAGSILLLLGASGFLVEASFATDPIAGGGLLGLEVNGWLNALHLGLGLLGIAMISFSPFAFGLFAGDLLIALGALQIAAGEGGTVIGLLPGGAVDGAFHIALGWVGSVGSALVFTRRLAERARSGPGRRRG